MAQLATERGDVILSGLCKIVVGLLLLTAVLFDSGAVLVNRLQLDEAARQAAHAGATTWASQRSHQAVQQEVLQRLSTQVGMSLDELTVGEGQVEITISRPAAVLFLDRINALARYASGSATSTSAFHRR